MQSVCRETSGAGPASVALACFRPSLGLRVPTCGRGLGWPHANPGRTQCPVGKRSPRFPADVKQDEVDACAPPGKMSKLHYIKKKKVMILLSGEEIKTLW